MTMKLLQKIIMFNFIQKCFKKDGKEAMKEYTNTSYGREAWVGVDLDGTLAYFDEKMTIDTIGEPVPAMLAHVKKMITNKIKVKIFTARAGDPEQLPLIRQWLKNNDLPELEITNIKDYYMRVLYDDRCVQVEKNTGRLISEKIC